MSCCMRFVQLGMGETMSAICKERERKRGNPCHQKCCNMAPRGTGPTVPFPFGIASQTVPTHPDLRCPQCHGDTTQLYTHPN